MCPNLQALLTVLNAHARALWRLGCTVVSCSAKCCIIYKYASACGWDAHGQHLQHFLQLCPDNAAPSNQSGFDEKISLSRTCGEAGHHLVRMRKEARRLGIIGLTQTSRGTKKYWARRVAMYLNSLSHLKKWERMGSQEPPCDGRPGWSILFI